jgi:GNAT superfamily N-acetyltransferase
MGEITPDNESRRLMAPVPLTASHDLSAFNCGVPALDDWLKNRALQNESRFSRTYVVCLSNRVVAYFCISAGSVARTDVPGKLRRNAPDNIPVATIGRLAVSRDHTGRGLGSDLLSDALRRIAVASRSIGIAAVVIQAKDEKAKAFYLASAEFLEFPSESRRLFLPIEVVLKTF